MCLPGVGGKPMCLPDVGGKPTCLPDVGTRVPFKQYYIDSIKKGYVNSARLKAFNRPVKQCEKMMN